MRMVSLLRPLIAAFSIGVVLAAVPACKKSTATTAPAGSAEVTASAEGVESVDKAPDAMTEENDFGSITYTVSPEGQVKAIVQTKDGKPIKKNVSGEFVFKGENGETKVPATIDENTGVIVAQGPKLDADLTPVSYSLTVDGNPWTGSVDLPKGGTVELAASAKFAADNPIPDGKVGPNGGVIQVVGDDRVEIVADKEGTGQVRAYFLDKDYKVIAPPADHTVKLSFMAEKPEIVVLEPEAEAGAYFVGRVHSRIDPVRLTVVVGAGPVVHTAIVGYRPGVHFVVGAAAPRVRVLVATGWPVVHLHGHGHGHGHGRVYVRGDDDDGFDGRVQVRGPSVGVVVGAPAVVVRPPSPPSVVVRPPSVGVGVHAGVGVSAGAHAGAGVKVGGKHR